MQVSCHFIATNSEYNLREVLPKYRNNSNGLLLEAVPTSYPDHLIDFLVDDFIYHKEANLIKVDFGEVEVRKVVTEMVLPLSEADIYPDSGAIGVEPEEWGEVLVYAYLSWQ